ncbi:hypothetical protein LPJ66_003534 [Kickxella alabastrina]|uniref:Uncharacterized protein n=1 Tax=Kickxella alabastrina TaxID=61397 RepID=A0ACC1IM16_9FUNG|nr:hypothetical protein LPJ66_003534 [Kickxella alabastrina]
MGNHLSFTITESELARQKASEDIGPTLEPRGTPDAIMIIVIALVYVIDFIATIYVLENPIIMACVTVANIIWLVGDLQANGHVPLANTPMAKCMVFGVWLRFLLGVCAVFSLVSLRTYGLYRVFRRNPPYHTLGLYLPFAIYCLCSIFFGIISLVLQPTQTAKFNPQLDLCNYNADYLIGILLFLWVTVAIGVILQWKIRNIKSSFNESRETLIANIIVFIVLMFATVMRYALPIYPLKISLRIINTCLNHLVRNSVWWFIMGVPLYKCLFDRERYLNQWIFKLRKDGLQKEYNVVLDSTATSSHGAARSHKMQGSLLRTNSVASKGAGHFTR